MSLHNTCSTEDGWALHRQCCSLSRRRRRSLSAQFTLVQVHRSHGMRSQALLGFFSCFTALFQGIWRAHSRMLLELCTNLAQFNSHYPQVPGWDHHTEQKQLARIKPKQKELCFQEKENILSGKQFLQSCIQWLRVCTKRPWTTSSGPAFLSDSTACKRPW